MLGEALVEAPTGSTEDLGLSTKPNSPIAAVSIEDGAAHITSRL